jgi:hypothetical protein
MQVYKLFATKHYISGAANCLKRFSRMPLGTLFILDFTLRKLNSKYETMARPRDRGDYQGIDRRSGYPAEALSAIVAAMVEIIH